MPSCECCWSEAQQRTYGGGDIHEEYARVQREHEDKRCVCVMITPEGDKARAGKFWDEAQAVDRREA